MSRDSRRRAEDLFAAMGGIEDRFLGEAIAAQTAQKRRRKHPWRILSIAASALLAVSLAVFAGISIGRGMRPGHGTDAKDPPHTEPQTFSALLLSCTESASFEKRTDTRGSVPADGTVRLVIGERGGGALWISRPLTASERVTVMTEAVRAMRQDSFEPASDSPLCVWLVSEKGEVWSPEVTYSCGNVTFGTIYDYNSERLPGTAFQNLLAGLAD